MTTRKENAGNDWYFYQYGDERPSEVITYMKNLIDEIKKHPNALDVDDIQSFSTENITYEKFKKFIEIAQREGYTIYSANKL